MSESDHITTILRRWQTGDDAAQEELFELVYRELRRIAAARLRGEGRNHSLQATELVHEIYPQLARQRAAWQNRSQFFALASECMRRFLVDYARSRTRQKRGGEEARRISVSDLKPTEICRVETENEILAVDRALARLEKINELHAAVIKYRYFGGMNREEIAEALETSPSTVDRAYRFAKAWLKRELAFEFSPYLLSADQIKNKPEFVRRLKSGAGDAAIHKWRDVLSDDLLAEIEAADTEAQVNNTLPKIVAEINRSMLGELYQTGGGDPANAQTEVLPDAQIKQSRRRLEDAFGGQITRLT